TSSTPQIATSTSSTSLIEHSHMLLIINALFAEAPILLGDADRIDKPSPLSKLGQQVFFLSFFVAFIFVTFIFLCSHVFFLFFFKLFSVFLFPLSLCVCVCWVCPTGDSTCSHLLPVLECA